MSLIIIMFANYGQCSANAEDSKLDVWVLDHCLIFTALYRKPSAFRQQVFRCAGVAPNQLGVH